MKIGSEVECIDNKSYPDLIHLNTPYTVRDILPIGTVLKTSISQIFFRTDELGIRVEGVYPNVTLSQGAILFDMPFPLKDFRELHLPDEIAEILENELQLI